MLIRIRFGLVFVAFVSFGGNIFFCADVCLVHGTDVSYLLAGGKISNFGDLVLQKNVFGLYISVAHFVVYLQIVQGPAYLL